MEPYHGTPLLFVKHWQILACFHSDLLDFCSMPFQERRRTQLSFCLSAKHFRGCLVSLPLYPYGAYTTQSDHSTWHLMVTVHNEEHTEALPSCTGRWLMMLFPGTVRVTCRETFL